MYKLDVRSGTWTTLTSQPDLNRSNPPGVSNICPTSAAWDPVDHVFIVAAPEPSGTQMMANLWTYSPGNLADQGTWTQIDTTTWGTPPLGQTRWHPLWYDDRCGMTQKSPGADNLCGTADDVATFVFFNNHGARQYGGANEGDAETWAFSYVSGNVTPAPTFTPANTPVGGTATRTPTRTRTPVSGGGTATPTRSAAPTATGASGTPGPGAVLTTLTVAELLPANDAGGYPPVAVSGHDRSQEPFTSGVALRDSDGVSSASQLALTDGGGSPIAGQFRALKTYPSGNWQWVLVDGQVDVPANGSTPVRLTRGSAGGAAALAVDSNGGNPNSGSITITTGAATFVIRKARQNLIDAAVVGGQTLLASGHSGALVYVDPGPTTYSSQNDAASRAVIEENGPLRAVVREEGRLVAASGERALGYTVRLSFYAGKSYVKAHVSVSNAYRDSVSHKQFTALEVQLPLVVSPASYDFALQSTQLGGRALGAGETAYLFQGATTHKANADGVAVNGHAPFYQEETDWGTSGFTGGGQDGFTIVQGASTLQAFTTPASYSRGFGDVRSSGGGGLEIAMRDFDAFFPAAIEFSGSGLATVGLWSKRNTAAPLSFGWSTHDSRDLLLDFHSSALADLSLDHYRVQYPLFAKAPYAQYRDTGALLHRTELVTHDEMVSYHAANDAGLGINQWVQANSGPKGVSGYVMPNEPGVRCRSFSWSDGGRETNNDFTMPKLLAFLQGGVNGSDQLGGLFQTAYNWSQFVVDQAIWRSDGDPAAAAPANSPDRTQWGTVPAQTGSGAPWGIGQPDQSRFEIDEEHENNIAPALLYYLTGDEGIRDALIDHGEWWLHDHPITVNCTPHARPAASRLKWLSVIWDVTGDSRFKAELDKAVDNELCSTITTANDGAGVLTDYGFSMVRGYRYDESNVVAGATVRMAPPGAGGESGANADTEVLLTLPDSDPRKEDWQDRMLGWAYWLVNEGYYDRSGDPCPAFGRPRVCVGGTNDGQPCGSGCPGTGASCTSTAELLDTAPLAEAVRDQATIFDQTALLTHGYRLTHDQRFRYVGERIVGAFGARGGPSCGGVIAVRQVYSPYASLYAQRFIYWDLHRNDFGVVYLNDDPASGGGLSVTNNGGGAYTLSWTVPANARRYQIKYGPQPMVLNVNFNETTRTYQYDPAVYANFWATNGDAVTDQPHNISGEPPPAAPGTQQSFTLSGLDPSQTYHFALRIETSTASARPSAPVLL